ncbi:MAG: DUF2793 domain-containing protein [Alphaproteobacteria bacterium]|nr:MAG: DUF2793 domain-containing protein [Alphaproteobacteria bacterium]
MSETPEFGLPLLAASQAQKHVTVNEALLRLDALFGGRVRSASLTEPPSVAEEGSCYLVAPGASGEWAGHDGALAIRINGGWDIVLPRPGWSVLDDETGRRMSFDGSAWRPDAQLISSGGAATLHRILETDHVLSPGPSSAVTAAIPAGSQVLGVSARVIEAITGTATSWSLGVTESPDRYGSGLGVALNSFASGLTGTPVSYYADTDLILTANGGDFAGGTVRIAVHLVQIEPPRMV